MNYFDKESVINVENLIKSSINSQYVIVIPHREKKISNNTCYRCGRYGHFAYDCYETLYTNGHYIGW